MLRIRTSQAAASWGFCFYVSLWGLRLVSSAALLEVSFLDQWVGILLRFLTVYGSRLCCLLWWNLFWIGNRDNSCAEKERWIKEGFEGSREGWHSHQASGKRRCLELNREKGDPPLPHRLGNCMFMTCIQIASIDSLIFKFPHHSAWLIHSRCLINAPGIPEC